MRLVVNNDTTIEISALRESGIDTLIIEGFDSQLMDIDSLVENTAGELLYYEDKDDSNGMNGRYGGGYYHHHGHRGPPIGMGPAFGPRPFGRPFGKGPRGGFHGHHHH